MTRRCQSRSGFGKCGREAKHQPPHAVPLGDGVWFGYERGGMSLGYGHFHDGAFVDCGRTGWQCKDAPVPAAPVAGMQPGIACGPDEINEAITEDGDER